MSLPLCIKRLLPALLLLAPVSRAQMPELGQIGIQVAQLLEQGHFTRHRLDDEISKRLLDTYLESLDPKRLFFTGEDIAKLRSQYETELDDYLLLGNPRPATEMQSLYRQRVVERVAWIKDFLAKEAGSLTYDSDRTIELSRQKSPWPANPTEADELWRNRIEAELLQIRLNPKETMPGPERLERRYAQLLKNIEQEDESDAINSFISCLALVYDPHSEYLDPSSLEDFRISMSNRLVGIGAQLRTDEGYAKITDLIAGGPAQIDGRLKVNDRIAAVAQGDDEFVDVIDMKLDKVVGMIRGKKGTRVRLLVLPADAADVASKSVVELVRDEVKLKDQDARAEVIERPGPDGKTRRLGWISLSSFYSDPKIGKSTSRDVARLLARLKKEGIEGLVLDLRRNGGGSLDEAVKLTGLFIRNGPVVQAKDYQGQITVQKDHDSGVVYDGPMIVLTSRLSASASEILAAALQDYGRAVVVGDQSTFGKGTVQTMLELGDFMEQLGVNPRKAGALKLTIQQFYRIAGGSTQLRGVASDVVIPTLTDNPEIGEGALKHPLPYDQLPALYYERAGDLQAIIPELRRRSESRVKTSREFRYVAEDLERVRERTEANTLSLNEAKRKAEIAADNARRDKRQADRTAAHKAKQTVYSLTLDNVDKPGLQKASNPKPKASSPDDEPGTEDGAVDDSMEAERDEALLIACDLIDLGGRPRTARK